MKVLGIVPARAGSVRLPRKNLRLLGGYPLVEWAIRAATNSVLLSRVVVSSDDPDVLELAEELLPGSALERPAALATATAPAIDYVRHALAETTPGQEEVWDAVAIIQPTSPFTRGADVDSTISLLESSNADSAVTVVRVAHDVHPAKLKLLSGYVLVPYLEDEEGRATPSELPEVYVRNGAVYAIRVSTIASGTLLGKRSFGLVMPRMRSVDINDELDLEFAEFLIRKNEAVRDWQE